MKWRGELHFSEKAIADSENRHGNTHRLLTEVVGNDKWIQHNENKLCIDYNLKMTKAQVPKMEYKNQKSANYNGMWGT